MRDARGTAPIPAVPYQAGIPSALGPRHRRRRGGTGGRRGRALLLILIDANILVYAHVRDFAQHERSRTWLDERLSGPGRVGLPWPSLVAFVRLVTNPRVFERPEAVAQAWVQVEAWLDADPSWIPLPTPEHRAVLGRLLTAANARANIVHDAHLAALAIEHGLAVASTDGDYARFADIEWINPLDA